MGTTNDDDPFDWDSGNRDHIDFEVEEVEQAVYDPTELWQTLTTRVASNDGRSWEPPRMVTFCSSSTPIGVRRFGS